MISLFTIELVRMTCSSDRSGKCFGLGQAVDPDV